MKKMVLITILLATGLAIGYQRMVVLEEAYQEG